MWLFKGEFHLSGHSLLTKVDLEAFELRTNENNNRMVKVQSLCGVWII